MLNKGAVWFRRLLILAAAIVIAYFLSRLIDLPNLTNEHLGYSFVTAGAMIGGVIAVVFSLSIFAQQNAANLYSSQYFEIYTHDWQEKLTYISIVLISITFFGAALYFNGQVQVECRIKCLSIYLSLLFISLVFILIDWQYQNVRRKINPIRGLSFLEKRSLKYLLKIQKDARRIANILKAKHRDVPESIALASSYNTYLHPRLLNLDSYLENLLEISLKLSDRQEILATRTGLSAIHNILKRYFDLRKDSSIATLSSLYVFGVESDSQSFLVRSLERFNKTGENFIKRNQIDLASYIADLYGSLASHAQHINFINRAYENPIFDLIKGYLKSYLDFARREKEIEVVYQGSRILGDLSSMALHKKFNTTLYGLQNDLYEIAIYGLIEKKTFITDNCVSSWLNTLLNLLVTYSDPKHHISHILELLREEIIQMNAFVRGKYLTNEFSTSFSLCKSFNEMPMVVDQLVRACFNVQAAGDKRKYISNLETFYEELHDWLRKLSDKLKDADSVLLDSIGRLIFHLNRVLTDLLVENDYADIHKSLEKCLSLNFDLPYWFYRDSASLPDSISHSSLSDSVSKTGILIFAKKIAGELLSECINSIYSLVELSLSQNQKKSDFDEPRLMRKLCLLGVLALKNNNKVILTEVGLRIYDFEDKYYRSRIASITLPPGVDPRRVSGLPKREQLLIEMLSWRSDFIREKYSLHLTDRAEDIMHNFVDEADIDRFIFEIWGVIPKYSPIESDLKDFAAKKREMVKFVRILKQIAKGKSKRQNT